MFQKAMYSIGRVFKLDEEKVKNAVIILQHDDMFKASAIALYAGLRLGFWILREPMFD